VFVFVFYFFRLELGELPGARETTAAGFSTHTGFFHSRRQQKTTSTSE
jgi:hypothetical protein